MKYQLILLAVMLVCSTFYLSQVMNGFGYFLTDIYWGAGTYTISFSDVLSSASYTAGFAATVFTMLAFSLVYYGSLRQNGSWMVMKRIPQKWETAIRCLTLPLITAAAAAAIGWLMTGFFYLQALEKDFENCTIIFR